MIEKLSDIKLVAMDVDGTFTNGILYYDNGGNVTKGFSSQDGMGLELLRRAGIIRGFISGRHDNATEARVTYLGVDFYLHSVGDKAVVLREILEEYNIDLSECLYIGDDLNDLSIIELAGVSAAVANACEEIRSRADFVTRAPGGGGAVRELADTILKAKNIDPVELWLSDKDRAVGM
ncbi:KdsC family phosphatase [Candidatus Latescibacterota bacterium]